MKARRTIGLVLVLAALLPLALLLACAYDGIEFNGDSFRYYGSAVNLLEAGKGTAAVVTGFWPLGYPLLVAANMAVFGAGFPAAQAVALLTGWLALYFLVRLYKCEYGVLGPEACVGFSLLLVSGYWLRYSTTIMSDLPALCWSLGALSSARRWYATPSARWLLATACFSALAIATRYVSGLVMVPVILSAWHRYRTGRARLTFLVSYLVATGIFLLPQLPFSLQVPDASVHHPWLAHWSVEYFYSADRTTIDGHLLVSWPNILYYLLAPFRWSELTPVGGLLAAWGLQHRLRKGLSITDLMAASWFLAVYLFLCGIPIQNPRFALPLYVPVAWFMVGGISDLRSRVSVRTGLAFTILYIGIAAYAGVSKWHGFVREKKRMLLSARSFDGRVPKDARILSWDFYEAFHIYMPARKISTIHGLDRASLQGLLDREGVLYLLFDEDRLERAWSGLEPVLAYRQLLARNPSELLERQGPYSLRRCVSVGQGRPLNSVPSPD